MQASKPAVLRRHHWLLIPIPLLACLFSAVKFSGRVPSQPLPVSLMWKDLELEELQEGLEPLPQVERPFPFREHRGGEEA